MSIVATLAIVLAASIAVFVALIRQATLGRQLERLQQWASQHRAQIEPVSSHLEILSPFHPKVSLSIRGEGWTLARLTTDPPIEAKGKTPRWHLLAVDLEVIWPSTGLRPVRHVVSILDLFGLSSYPSLTAGEDFVIFGADSAGAESLSDSNVHGVLPPDIGLLLHEHTLLLDFSGREFEGPELNRILELANRLTPELSLQRPSRPKE